MIATSLPGRVAGVASLLLAALLFGLSSRGDAAEPRPAAWSADEMALLASLSIDALPPAPPDPSNAVESLPRAAALGKKLFNDTQLSSNQRVACASCHASERQFQDDRPVGEGVGRGARRTMPVVAAAHNAWLFWDGRKDSLWSQALGPLEDAAEHGSNRVRLVRTLQARHRADYEAVFGPLPDLAALPADAGPLGSPAERAAWAGMSSAQRDGVNRAFANLGKAIAAYERSLSYGESRFDRYLRALRERDSAAQAVLSAQEVDGLRLFIGKGQCATCHNGPLLSDQHFHNTGVPPRDAARPDRGRAAAVAKVQGDEFNCLGPYSDAKPATGSACQELRFIADADPAMEGAFRTPGLRNVAQRAPYMHAGQFATLEQVVAHYARSPAAAIGHSELAQRGGRNGHAERRPIELSAREQADLVAFLRTLSGPIVERMPAP